MNILKQRLKVNEKLLALTRVDGTLKPWLVIHFEVEKLNIESNLPLFKFS